MSRSNTTYDNRNFSSPGIGNEDLLANPNDGLEILDAFPDMCFIVGENGKLIRANAKGARIIGREPPTSHSRTLQSYLRPSYRPGFESKLRHCLLDGSSETLEAEFQTTKNEVASVELVLTKYLPAGARTRPVCMVVARDISDRKKQELDLLRFTNLAHYTVNPIEITDINGHIIYVNPAFEKASGYSKEELLGKNPNVFSSHKHPKAFWQKMWQTISSGNVWVGEVENRRRTGEPFYTQLLISPIVAGNGMLVGYFGIHRDISEQKQLEQSLMHAQKMESIGLLAAGLAHEVGNPLTSISSLVQVIQRTSSDEFTQEKLELIKSQVSRISRIIRDLVDFSRRSTYEVQLTDINKNIRDAVEIVRIGKKAKDITFNVALEDDLPLLSLVPDQIEQVFINLIINAVDALYEQPSGQPAQLIRKKQKTITVRSSRVDNHIMILIEDNGKGIHDEDLPKIFEPFFTTKKVGEGTGLGLWVSYGIVKSFHGEIKVKSSAGVGTTFTIRLPIKPDLS